jgi:hypothetical protein
LVIIKTEVSFVPLVWGEELVDEELVIIKTEVRFVVFAWGEELVDEELVIIRTEARFVLSASWRRNMEKLMVDIIIPKGRLLPPL